MPPMIGETAEKKKKISNVENIWPLRAFKTQVIAHDGQAFYFVVRFLALL